jgi:FkbM family methyltransferase
VGESPLSRSWISRRSLTRTKLRLKKGVSPFVDNRIYTARRGLTRGLKRKGGFDFVPLRTRPTKEEVFLQALDFKGRTVYDVGGGRGRFTLFFARAVGSSGNVVTFEPNPMNYRNISDQVVLNEFASVQIFQLGLGKRRQRATLAFRPADPGRGTASTAIQKQTLQHVDAVTVPIELDSMDHQITSLQLPPPDFIKIDVEGLEFDVLQGMVGTMQRRRPDIFIEIHGSDSPDKTQNAQRIVEFLLTAGYSLYHVESETGIDATNAEMAKEGHLHCSAGAAAPGSAR